MTACSTRYFDALGLRSSQLQGPLPYVGPPWRVWFPEAGILRDFESKPEAETFRAYAEAAIDDSQFRVRRGDRPMLLPPRRIGY